MPITKRRRHQRGVKKSRRVKKVRRSRKGRKGMRKSTKRRTHRKYKGGDEVDLTRCDNETYAWQHMEECSKHFESLNGPKKFTF